jgi:chromosome segregation ATPase
LNWNIQREQKMSDDTCVICPNCVHEFPAIPVNVQERIAELEAEVERLREDMENNELVHNTTINTLRRQRSELEAEVERLREALHEIYTKACQALNAQGPRHRAHLLRFASEARDIALEGKK